MKLHAIAVENLSSLYGEHTIDFEADLCDAPLFVIVGPTGAGKSTLLDAVSLALFGETPRLDNSRARDKGDDGDSRHIMSRGVGACRAVLVFSRRDLAGARVRYRATWACHRANQQADGAFQTPRRALERLDSASGAWELLVDDHRRKFTEPHFARALDGLTVADFQRSILLAQGAFTALLRAGTEEKAAILERLTSTEIYADLGRRANRMRIEATAAFDLVNGRLEGMQLLGAEELATLERSLAAAHGRVAACRAKLARLEREAAWVARADALEVELEAAEAAHVAAVAADQEATPERALLADDLRARPAAELRAALARDRAELEAVATQLDGLAARRERLAGELAAARAVEAAARTASEAALTERRVAGPAIDEARRLAEASRQAAQGRDAVERTLAAATSELDRATEHRAALATRADEAEALLTAAAATADGLGGRRVLADALSGLEARAARLADDDRRIRALGVELEVARAEVRAAGEAEASALAALTSVRAEAASLPPAPAEVPADPERRVAELTRQVEALTEAVRLAGARRAVAERRAAREADRLTLLSAIAAARAAAAAERQAGALLRVELEGLAARRDDLELAVSLGEHRGRLSDGAPCPLCGSEAHPWRHDRALEAQDATLRASRDEVVAALAARREALTRHERALGAHDKALARDEGLRGRLEDELADLATEEDDRTARLVALLGAEAPDAATTGGARAEAALAQRLEAVRAERSALAAVVRDAASRRLLAERVAAAIARSDGLAEQHEQARGRAGARASASAREVAASELRARELAESLASFGVEVPNSGAGPDLRAGLRRAVRDVDDWRRAVEAQEVAARAVAGERVELERAAARVEALAARVEALVEEVAGSEARAADAALAAASALGGEPVDRVADRLDASVVAAREALDQAVAAVAGLASDHAGVAGQSGVLAERRDAVADRVAARRLALDVAIAALDLVDEAGLDALVLDDERRASLEARVASLSRAVERAADAVARVGGAIAAHQAARPEGLVLHAAGEPAAKVQPARAELDDANQALGAIRGELDRHHATARRHADIKVEWDTRCETMLLWKRLHRLIGEGDGKAFQEFAQILNLQELVDRANHHLRALAPRYALVTATDREGLPRLDFAIRDTWLAGRQRPITTLSGGETFLVSLALALGLADMRSVGMPVETLLLDEGFGTLDPRALDTAVEALERLNAKSRVQVGIISHVEGLRERIEARVVVEPLGNGRSRVRAELGASAPLADQKQENS